METFKKECKEYLNTLSIGDLRRYGRYVGLQRPTDMKKQALIDEIIATLCGKKVRREIVGVHPSKTTVF